MPLDLGYRPKQMPLGSRPEIPTKKGFFGVSLMRWFANSLRVRGTSGPDNRDHFLQFIPPESRLRGLRWSRGNAETVTQIRQLFQYDRAKDHSITTGYRKVIA